MIRIAAAQYPIDELETFAAYRAKLSRWVEDAARDGAQLLVFPEYGAMELTRLAGRAIAADLGRSIEALQAILPEAEALHAELARVHNVHILAASAPIKQNDGRFCNTAVLVAPNNGRGAQQKLMLTRFEDEQWGIAAGAPLRVFETALGRVGIAICFDVEFPLIARALVEAGAEIILTPSCTDALSGYWRVRIGAQARALENQCVVVQAPLVGNAPWSLAIDENVGAAGVFGPPDLGFPSDGVMALGAMNAPQWLHAAIDPQAISVVRANGAVLNHKRWAMQPGAPALGPLVELVRLS